jgi:hypothetical protein
LFARWRTCYGVTVCMLIYNNSLSPTRPSFTYPTSRAENLFPNRSQPFEHDWWYVYLFPHVPESCELWTWVHTPKCQRIDICIVICLLSLYILGIQHGNIKCNINKNTPGQTHDLKVGSTLRLVFYDILFITWLRSYFMMIKMTLHRNLLRWVLQIDR